MNISEMVDMTREVTNLFRNKELRPWDIQTMMTELVGEVGTLADSIMIYEGFRCARDEKKPDLADDVADIMFMLIRIADHYDINVERSYKVMIDSTKSKLLNRQLQTASYEC